MCFVLYIATNNSISDIPFDENAPALNIQALTEHELPVRDVFTLPHVKFLGSSASCGCGYRHLSFQNGEWPEEYLIGTDSEFGADTQDDHESLHHFLLEQLKSNDKIELYGCWEGEFNDPPSRHETIGVRDVINDQFFLRERCHYTISSESTAENVG